MVERTDEVEVDPDATDGEAQAAIEEAQSVLDDVESSTSTGNSGGLLGGGSGSKSKSESKGESDSGGLLPSFSLPSLSMPSMPSPDELFSTRWFTVSLVATAASLLLGGMVIPVLGQFGAYIALFAVMFVLGLASSDSHYVEVGLAAALVSGVFALLSNITFAFASGTTLNLVLFGGGLGLVAGVIGYYFGRDLKSGLGKDVGGGDGPGGDDVPEW